MGATWAGVPVVWAARRTSAHTRDHTQRKTHSGHRRITYSPPNSKQPLLSLSHLLLSVEKPPNSSLGDFSCIHFKAYKLPLGDGKFLQPLSSWDIFQTSCVNLKTCMLGSSWKLFFHFGGMRFPHYTAATHAVKCELLWGSVCILGSRFTHGELRLCFLKAKSGEKVEGHIDWDMNLCILLLFFFKVYSLYLKSPLTE